MGLIYLNCPRAWENELWEKNYGKRKIWAVIWTRGSWVRSTNATSVLCCPPDMQSWKHHTPVYNWSYAEDQLLKVLLRRALINSMFITGPPLASCSSWLGLRNLRDQSQMGTTKMDTNPQLSKISFKVISFTWVIFFLQYCSHQYWMGSINY